ncbi:protein kinase [Pendulispora brunnea]|uniref:Protein kinase n=1 Tax=Pendulispora brunnea TaxID=2905690 RepID=A0ABZ2KKN4_9BACT
MGDEFAAGHLVPRTPYRVVKQLGKGAMGAVYEVLDTSVDAPYVIKTLLPSLLENRDMVTLMGREARTLANLSHENIVRVFTAGVTPGGTPYFVMDRLTGATLRAYFGTRGFAPRPITTIDLVIQVLRGLEHAHDRGIVHRDIKPENIFLHLPDLGAPALGVPPREPLVKLLDFGILKLLEDGPETRRFMGTPMWASPEQIVGKNIGPRSDLYSVGVLLFYMLSASFPFKHRTYSEAVAWLQSYVQPPLVQELIPDLHPALRDTITSALHPDPEKRPRDAAVFIAQLLRARRLLDESKDWNLTGATYDLAGGDVYLASGKTLAPSPTVHDHALQALSYGETAPAPVAFAAPAPAPIAPIADPSKPATAPAIPNARGAAPISGSAAVMTGPAGAMTGGPTVPLSWPSVPMTAPAAQVNGFALLPHARGPELHPPRPVSVSSQPQPHLRAAPGTGTLASPTLASASPVRPNGSTDEVMAHPPGHVEVAVSAHPSHSEMARTFSPGAKGASSWSRRATLVILVLGIMLTFVAGVLLLVTKVVAPRLSQPAATNASPSASVAPQLAPTESALATSAPTATASTEAPAPLPVAETATSAPTAQPGGRESATAAKLSAETSRREKVRKDSAPEGLPGSGLETARSTSTGSAPSGRAPLSTADQARAVMLKDPMSARHILEPSVFGSHPTREEIELLETICKNQKDKVCETRCERLLEPFLKR